MKNGRMQCKDIPDRPVLEFLARFPYLSGRSATWDAPGRDNCVSQAMPAQTPAMLQLAKMRRLIQRGLVEGCDCGCYGQFQLTDKGAEALGGMAMPTLTESPVPFGLPSTRTGSAVVDALRKLKP